MAEEEMLTFEDIANQLKSMGMDTPTPEEFIKERGLPTPEPNVDPEITRRLCGLMAFAFLSGYKDGVMVGKEIDENAKGDNDEDDYVRVLVGSNFEETHHQIMVALTVGTAAKMAKAGVPLHLCKGEKFPQFPEGIGASLIIAPDQATAAKAIAHYETQGKQMTRTVQ